MRALPIDTAKAELRRLALARRDGLTAESCSAAATAVAARPLPVETRPSMIVSGYIPIRSEFDPRPLMQRFAEAGAQLALPCVTGRGQPLVMRAWRFGEPLVSRQWGLREPAADAPEVLPDILLVPLAAFDRAGHRIGYGAGYYDMTIARLRALKPVTAIGVAYAMQEVSQVPADERDARLDLVLTEGEVIDPR
ncbi:MAG: 5-formyltetrahydrofolate cyclo-ligase [Rhodoplanes sp.]